MKDLFTLQQELQSGALDAQLSALCGAGASAISEKRSRLLALIAAFASALQFLLERE